MIKIWKDIEKKQFSPLYLLYGTEEFLMNETKQKLLEHVLTEEERDFNFASYDLEETPIEAALEEAETLPFMGERRLILLHNPVFLTAERTKGKVEHNTKKLEAYLENPAPYTILVFLASYEKLDERKKLTKALKAKAVVLEAKKLGEKELRGWIKERAEINNVRIDEEAIDHLIGIAGTDLMMLITEVDKLSLYCQDTKQITAEIVDRLTARSLEQDIFQLVEKVVQRKMDEALRIYYDLLKLNEEPIKILAVIANQFRLIYQVKELTRKGYSQQQIAGTIKVHPYRVKLASNQAKNFSDEQLAAIMNMLAESDYLMKTGGMSKTLIIEMFLFKLRQQT